MQNSMNFQEAFDFSDLHPEGFSFLQQAQAQQQPNDNYPTEGNPNDVHFDINAILGVSLDNFLQDWAQISPSSEQFITGELDVNANGNLCDSSYEYGNMNTVYPSGSGNASVAQPMALDQELCISPQALFVSPQQHALSSHHAGLGGIMPRVEHVYEPVVPSNVDQSNAYFPPVDFTFPSHISNAFHNTTSASVPPQVASVEVPSDLPIMYPRAEPRKLGQLQAGYYHLLSKDPVPTPQNMLEGTFAAAMRLLEAGVITMAQMRDVVLTVPRPIEMIGGPGLPPIIFVDLNKRGRPGPYVGDILNGDAKLEGPEDSVMEPYSWKIARILVKWPGCDTKAKVISCTNPKGQPITRTELAHAIATQVQTLFQDSLKMRKFPQIMNANTAPWDMRKVKPKKVRVIGLSYYHSQWIPILATNAEGSIWDRATGPFPAVDRPELGYPLPLSPDERRMKTLLNSPLNKSRYG